MDTLLVSTAQLDSTLNAIQRGDYKTAGVWLAVLVVGLAAAYLAKRYGIIFKNK